MVVLVGRGRASYQLLPCFVIEIHSTLTFLG